jgi:GNAT superfamily N-acetyltransferase
MEYKTENHNEKDVEMLLTKFLDESVFEGFVCLDSIKKFIAKNEFFTVVVYDKDPVAVFMGYKYEHPFFKGDTLASDLLMYVSPEHRGGMIAPRLVKRYIKWATDLGVRYIQLGQSTGIGSMERVAKFYEGMGFKTVGFNTLKEV